jgi:hypothetical protein
MRTIHRTTHGWESEEDAVDTRECRLRVQGRMIDQAAILRVDVSYNCTSGC